jgi:autotransporter translocation and assembly factor TamB
VRNAAIDLGGSIMPIVGLSLEIEAKDRRLTLSGKGKSGSGRINITGQSKVTSQGLEDIAIRLRTSKVPVVIASLVCSLDLDSHSQIVLKPGLVDIKTKIDNAFVRIPVRSFVAGTRSLHSLDGMSDLVYVSPAVEDEDTNIDQSGTLVRLRILARNTVAVRAKVMQATLGLDLDTTFVDDKVVVNGSANVASGHIDLFARRYVIEKASANFRGRVPVNPSFDFRLRHDFDQLALSILGRGDLDDQKIDFTGEPAEYDQGTLLAIVLGRAPAQNDEEIGSRGDDVLNALSSFAASKVQELLAPILPFDLDVLRVENTENDGYLYTGGKWINDDWFVAFKYRTLADELENTQEAQSKYRLSKSWSLEGAAGDSEGGVDILWTKRWGK